MSFSFYLQNCCLNRCRKKFNENFNSLHSKFTLKDTSVFKWSQKHFSLDDRDLRCHQSTRYYFRINYKTHQISSSNRISTKLMKVLRTEKIPHFHISLLKMMTYIRKEKKTLLAQRFIFNWKLHLCKKFIPNPVYTHSLTCAIPYNCVGNS